MAVEEHPFTLERRTPQFELRRYDAVIVAETRIEAGFEEAGPRGFEILTGYMSGHNQSRTKRVKGPFTTQKAPADKIAMAAPVNLVQTPWGILGQFTMPSSFSLAALPKPDDDRIHLRSIPPRQLAVIRYSGSWSEANYQKHRKELIAALKADGIPSTGEATFARFNSPFQLWFLRRNEVWIEVTP